MTLAGFAVLGAIGTIAVVMVLVGCRKNAYFEIARHTRIAKVLHYKKTNASGQGKQGKHSGIYFSCIHSIHINKPQKLKKVAGFGLQLSKIILLIVEMQ